MHMCNLFLQMKEAEEKMREAEEKLREAEVKMREVEEKRMEAEVKMREVEEKRREAEVKMSGADATAARMAALEVQQVCGHRMFSSHRPCEQEAFAYINFTGCHNMIDIPEMLCAWAKHY
jgi:hypothetical protein